MEENYLRCFLIYLHNFSNKVCYRDSSRKIRDIRVLAIKRKKTLNSKSNICHRNLIPCFYSVTKYGVSHFKLIAGFIILSISSLRTRSSQPTQIYVDNFYLKKFCPILISGGNMSSSHLVTTMILSYNGFHMDTNTWWYFKDQIEIATYKRDIIIIRALQNRVS